MTKLVLKVKGMPCFRTDSIESNRVLPETPRFQYFRHGKPYAWFPDPFLAQCISLFLFKWLLFKKSFKPL